MSRAIGRIMLAGWSALVLPACGTIHNMVEDTPGGSPWFFGGVRYDIDAIHGKNDPPEKPDRARKVKAALATLDLPLSAAADTALATAVVCVFAAAIANKLSGDSEDDTPDIPTPPPDGNEIRALRGD